MRPYYHMFLEFLRIYCCSARVVHHRYTIIGCLAGGVHNSRLRLRHVRLPPQLRFIPGMLPRRKSRRAVSPRKPDTPAMPVSSFVPKVDIYDGRPPILPVWLQLSDFPGDAISSSEEESYASVASSESPAHVFAPPGDPASSSASWPASSSSWTVSREMWCEALLPHVSGVSTDIVLFSEWGAPLIHHYLVFNREARTTPCVGAI